MRKILLLAVLAGSVLGGCYVDDSAQPQYAGDGQVAPAGYVEPEMVDVSPGVQVVYDADYPVFFSDGFYWRNDGGVWYSSRYHTGGWAVRRDVPYGVRGIRNPEGYRHYRPSGYVSRRGGEVRGRENVRVRENGAVRSRETVRTNEHVNVRGNGQVRTRETTRTSTTVRTTNKHR